MKSKRGTVACRCVTDLISSLPVSDTRYMRMRVPYMARTPGQLTVPGGAMVFIFSEEDRDGMATVIYDGQVGRRRAAAYNEPNIQDNFH